jgi:hypothetical protein
MTLENSFLVALGPARARTLSEPSGGAEETVAKLLVTQGIFRDNGSPVWRSGLDGFRSRLTNRVLLRDTIELSPRSGC